MQGAVARGASTRRGVLSITGALLAAVILLPAQARAACGVRTPNVGWQLAVHLSHGYCLTVTPADASPFGGGQALIVQTTKGSLATGLTRVEYRAKSKDWSDQWTSLTLARSDNWLDLSLGKPGKLAVHFHARRTAPLPPSGGCAGQDGKQLLGTWKGTIIFTGEQRYATVDSHATAGTVILKPATPSDPNCGQPVTVGPTDIPGPFTATTLTLSAQPAGSTYVFDAFLAQGVSTVQFNAYSGRAADGSTCTVQRLAPAATIAPSRDLDWNAQTPPSSATLTPPAPFSGTGSYVNGTLTGTISYYCPNEHRNVPVLSPAPASWSFFP